MVNEEAVQEYSNSIKILKKQCTDAGMSEDEFRKLYFDSLKSLENNRPVVQNCRRTSVKYHVLVVGIVILLGAVYNYKSLYSSLQEYIYPGLKLLRRISIPIISLFPSLTDLYHETCLIQNPFFTIVDMDCWPCSSITIIREVYDPKPVGPQHNAPFIYETDQQVITLETVKELYTKNKKIFDKESSKILTNNKYYVTPKELFQTGRLAENKNTYIWRCNSMNIARVLRQLIPRPRIVPKFGQSTERFIIVDSSQEKFNIPDTECSFSFLLSLSGSRTIDLIPAEECKHQCKTLKVELKESYLLWYNWWYWRPCSTAFKWKCYPDRPCRVILLTEAPRNTTFVWNVQNIY